MASLHSLFCNLRQQLLTIDAVNLPWHHGAPVAFGGAPNSLQSLWESTIFLKLVEMWRLDYLKLAGPRVLSTFSALLWEIKKNLQARPPPSKAGGIGNFRWVLVLKVTHILWRHAQKCRTIDIPRVDGDASMLRRRLCSQVRYDLGSQMSGTINPGEG